MTNQPSKKENIFVQTVTIDEMEIEYDTKMVENSKYIDDIGIRCKLDIGRDFKPNYYVGGSYRKSKLDNSVEGWGTAYKVKLFLERMGVLIKLQKGSSASENRLPDDLGSNFIGKTFHRLTYISKRKNKNGDNYKTDWQQIGSSSESKSKIKAEFLKAINDGYVKDFLQPNSSQTSDSSEMTEATEGEIKKMVSGNIGI